jgi:hypothetical protein
MRAGQGLRLEDGPPLRIGLADQRLPAGVHDVEDQVGHRDRGHQPRRRLADMHPTLQGREARAAADERGDLPVQDHVPGPGLVAQAGQFRVGPGHVPVAAGEQAQPSGGHVGHRPHAVPLELRGPRGLRFRDLCGGHRQHRRYPWRIPRAAP